MSLVGGIGSPYRLPCGYGSWPSPPRYWLGSPWQHYRAADASYPRYKNTTTVPNPNCGNNYGATGQDACASCSPVQPANVPPFRWPNCLNVECNPPTDCTTPGFNPTLDGFEATPPPLVTNTYALYDPAQTVNLAQCRKMGFKNVFAQKQWHGAFGFGAMESNCGCPEFGPGLPSPVQTKYRSITWSATCTYTDEPDGVSTETISGSMTIDRYTGKRSGSYTYSASNTPTGDPGMTERVLSHADGDILPEDAIGTYFCNGVWVSPGGAVSPSPADILNGTDTDGGAWTVTSSSVTETGTTFELTWSSGPQGAVIACSVSYGDAYTSDNVNADVNNLLAKWDMSNDAQYPWRTDAFCTRGPLVTFYENVAQAPGYFLGADYLTGTYSFDGSTYSYSFTGTITDSSPYDGSVLGAPNPPGYDPYWDAQHRVCEWLFDGDGAPTGIDVFCWGDFAPTASPDSGGLNLPFATQWTDDIHASQFRPGSFAWWNGGSTLTKAKWAEVILLSAPSFNYGRPWGYRDSLLRDQTEVDCGTEPCSEPWPDQYGTLLFDACPGIAGQNIITAATNASPIQITLQRPAGWRTGDQIDVSNCLGNTAANGSAITITVIDNKNATLNGTTGNGAYTGGGIAISHGAPSYGWDDNNAKGDWCWLDWTYDWRTNGTNSAPNATFVNQVCSQFIPCCPAVVYITPDDFTQPSGEFGSLAVGAQSIPMTNLDADGCFGALSQTIPKQWMSDPYYQRPVPPCDKLDDGCSMACAWTEDDGSGHADDSSGGDNCRYYYPQRTWYECRSGVPSGAPALAGSTPIVFNDPGWGTGVSGADPGTNPPQAPGEIFTSDLGGCGQSPGSVAPGAPNGAWMPVWVWAVNRLETITTMGRFACEYADPMAVCADDSEDSPV